MPGDYTLASRGGDGQVNKEDQPSFEFRIIRTKFHSRSLAENMGDITDQYQTYSLTDTFSCNDNPNPELPGCQPYETKLIYRKFYISRSKIANIQGGTMRLFRGRASNLGEKLTPWTGREASGNPWPKCFSLVQTLECEPLTGEDPGAGCDSTYCLTLTVAPAINTAETRTLCAGEAVTSGSQTVTRDTMICLMLTAAAGCDSVHCVTVDFLDANVTQLTGTICEGEVYRVSDAAYTATGRYEWRLPVANGCDSVILTGRPPLYAEISVTDPPCHGEAGGRIVIEPREGSGPFLYALNGRALQASNTFTGLAAGAYTLHGQDTYGCTWSDWVTLQTPPFTVALTPAEADLWLGDSVQMTILTQGTDLDSIWWTPAVALSCTDCLKPTVWPSQSGRYTVSVRNRDGCIATATLDVRLDRQLRVHLPNALRMA